MFVYDCNLKLGYYFNPEIQLDIIHITLLKCK